MEPTLANLRIARERANLSQADLAERVYGDRKMQSAISSFENGRANPTVEMLHRLAEALECDLLIDFVPK